MSQIQPVEKDHRPAPAAPATPTSYERWHRIAAGIETLKDALAAEREPARQRRIFDLIAEAIT